MNDLELSPGFFATPDRYLWHPASATAILSDLHLGAEAELTRRGMFMPDVSSTALKAAWMRMADRLQQLPQVSLIIAGDLFDVPKPDPQSIALATQLFRSLPSHVTVTLLLGNHDPTPADLRDYFRDVPMTIAEQVKVGGYTITHGDNIAKPLPPALIVGHQHPAVILQDRVQSAKMICYGTAQLGKGRNLLILPAFSRAPLGSNLLTSHNWILDLPRPSDDAVRIAGIIEPQGSPARVLDFGPLAALRQLA